MKAASLFSRPVRSAALLFTAAAALCACSASRSVPSAPSPNAGGAAPALRSHFSPPPGPSLAIDAGGGATGAFVADEDFNAAVTSTLSTTKVIDTSQVGNPAPQAVYQTQRIGSTITYTIPNLEPNQSYTVRLDFCELQWTSAGQREFDVSINGTSVLSDFDIVATAGAEYAAVDEAFPTTTTSSGTIAITFTAVIDNAAINGIEVSPSAVDTPSPGAPRPRGSSSPVAFNDYSTFGYDNARDVFNPNSTTLTPTSLSALHLVWQTKLGGGDYNTLTQPILATEVPGHSGVLFAGGGSGNVYGYDATTGTLLWTKSTGNAIYACENGQTIYFGVGGTVAYDPASASIYVVGNQNAGANEPLTNTLYHLSAADGSVLGSVAIAPPVPGWPSLDFSHTAVTLGPNGVAYVGTGATCDISSWRGRVAAIDVPAMTLAQTFYTTWNPPSQPWGGGGVWGWGGVSLDAAGNVYTGVGNTDNGTSEHGAIVAPYSAAPEEYSAYGDSFLKISSDLSTVEASDQPVPPGDIDVHTPSNDLDINGTPVIFQPPGIGCPQLAALQGKQGSLYLFNTAQIGSGPIATFQLAPSSYADGFLGSPSYSPVTGLLYVATPSSDDSLYPPGMIAINPGCGFPSLAWDTAFGPDSYATGSTTSPGIPRSVPAASAGGVVFVGTMCVVSGGTCAATPAAAARRARTAVHPLICCAPEGTEGGALWALDANTGVVLNGGAPLLITNGPIRVPPTLDGDWIFVIDNNGDAYALTIDPNYAPIQTKQHLPSPRQRETLNIHATR